MLMSIILEVVPISKQLIFSMKTRRRYQVMPICTSQGMYLYPNDKRSESKFPVLIIGARELGKVLNVKNNFWSFYFTCYAIGLMLL